jgi:AraC family transcriptional regulator of adaptative response/methylated-DNA-[protein]-cysteine methyltransferase
MLSEDRLWEAVESRNPQWDGMFVYGVASTRIYCRPTCPSRRPRRSGVRFFAAPSFAEAAGFRACRRCVPSAAAGSLPPHLDRVRRACALLTRRAPSTVPLGALARAVGSSPHHLQRLFKRTLGVSPRDYADAFRVGALKSQLRAGLRVADATYEAGYGSGSRVYERSSSTLGMTPGAYAAGGKGTSVQYVISDSPLGQLLVAATERGICAIKLGDRARPLEDELRREYPHAAIAPGDDRLREWVAAIVGSVNAGAPDPRLPTDVRATAFQRRVWQELQQIPRGATRSYKDVAARIGRPSAARAVARACASNPVALIVPCHRVVQQDGGLGGYHWGVARKRALLKAERTE